MDSYILKLKEEGLNYWNLLVAPSFVLSFLDYKNTKLRKMLPLKTNYSILKHPSRISC